VLIEGPAGIGKSRLANELCLAGTLKGTVTLKADAESTSASFGVAVALCKRLLETAPEIARRAVEPHAAVLRKLSGELADVLGPDSGGLAGDLAESRIQFHLALRDWFLAVGRERPLLVAVDNLHAADDDSASFLATLGRESRSSALLVISTLRTGSSIQAPDTVRVIRERATRLKLAGLDAKACELLASGLFGGAANAGRVASLLFERSSGNPRQFIELAQLMAQRKIAKYEAGGWVLPFDVADGELPDRAEEILVAQVASLGADARTLAANLAVHVGAVSLGIVLAVSELPGEGRTYAVLDELIAEQVLASEVDGYRFRHDAIRETILSRTDPEVRRRCRLRMAEALLDGGGAAERVEAALHLIDAGEENRGARILVTAARDFAAGAGMHQNPEQLVRGLCSLVRSYDRQGRSEYELAALLLPLLPLAYYSANWQFVLEYGERAIDIAMRITGLARAAELEPELGREEALKRGLGEGAAGFAKHVAEGMGYDLKTAIAATIGVVPTAVAIYGTCLDAEAVARVARAVAPLALLGEEHIAHTMQIFASAEVPLIAGRESEARSPCERALARFGDAACASAIGEGRAKTLQGGVLFMLGILDTYSFSERALETASRMESLGVKSWAVTADQIRILYHSLRGESIEVKNCLERVELNAIQGAQAWQVEVYWPALLLNADVLASDAMAARRRHVQLERRSKEVAALKPYAEAARAAYVMLRGNVAEAVSLYEKLIPSYPIQRRVGWETTRAYFARALNAAGAHERAKAIAEEVVSHMLPSDHELVAHFLEAKRQLALAESGLGHHERAAALLDDLLAKHGHESNALLVGLLHQARAEVARRAKDKTTAQKHHAEMESRFRGTQNPALVAQCERTRRGDEGALPRQPQRDAHQQVPNTVTAFARAAAQTLPSAQNPSSTLEQTLQGSAEPLETALALVMQQTKAKCAYLYVPVGNAFQLAWSSTNDDPPSACVEELHHWMDVLRENDPDDTGGYSTLIVDTETVSGFRLVALRRAAEKSLIGGLIIEAEQKVDLVGSSELFDALGRIVEEYGQEAKLLITA
jgi:hypothetical protein